MLEANPPRLDNPSGNTPDPATNLEFWGRDRASLGRSGVLGVVDRLRGDPRVGVVALLVVALVVGLAWYRIGSGDAARSSEGSRTSASSARRRPTRTATTTTAPGVVLVAHVAGAVARPGVVRLAAGSRVVDALEAAGGARPEADLDQLNLAAKVVDGQRIAVAVRGAAAAGPVEGGTAASGTGVAGAGATSTPVNLNAATATELEALPGIGPTLAAAILRERDRRGGFRSVDELRSVRGIGERRFADLRELVTV